MLLNQFVDVSSKSPVATSLIGSITGSVSKAITEVCCRGRSDQLLECYLVFFLSGRVLIGVRVRELGVNVFAMADQSTLELSNCSLFFVVLVVVYFLKLAHLLCKT